MFDGILSDVIGRDRHVNETGNGNNNNDGACVERLGDRWTQADTAVSAVGVVERHVTRCHSHAVRMRGDPAAVTSSRRDLESPAATDAGTPTTVSRLAGGFICEPPDSSVLFSIRGLATL